MADKKTMGANALELLQKPDGPTNPQEYQRAQEKEYLSTLIDTVKVGRKVYDGDFYVVCITKKERLMENVLRNYFFHRVTCPTPDYDQTVYKFVRDEDEIHFMWTIPAKDICLDLLENANRIGKEEYELLESVRRFQEGSLYMLAKKENHELVTS